MPLRKFRKLVSHHGPVNTFSPQCVADNVFLLINLTCCTLETGTIQFTSVESSFYSKITQNILYHQVIHNSTLNTLLLRAARARSGRSASYIWLVGRTLVVPCLIIQVGGQQ